MRFRTETLVYNIVSWYSNVCHTLVFLIEIVWQVVLHHNLHSGMKWMPECQNLERSTPLSCNWSIYMKCVSLWIKRILNISVLHCICPSGVILRKLHQLHGTTDWSVPLATWHNWLISFISYMLELSIHLIHFRSSLDSLDPLTWKKFKLTVYWL